MTTETQNSVVHSGSGREKTEAFGVRFPASLVRLLEAVQAMDRDADRSSTVRKAVERYVEERLGQRRAEVA